MMQRGGSGDVRERFNPRERGEKSFVIVSRFCRLEEWLMGSGRGVFLCRGRSPHGCRGGRALLFAAGEQSILAPEYTGGR